MLVALICFTFSCVDPHRVQYLEPIIVDNMEQCKIHIEGELNDYSELPCHVVAEKLNLRG